jgi:hypothetical protein
MKKYFKSVMKIRQQIIMILLIIVVSSAFSNILSQDVQPKPSRQSSFEAFSKENYEQAYKEFGILLQTYTKDPQYKYYSGVCLVKLNRNPEEALALLKQALQGASVVKTLPQEAYFYLGRAQQMSGKYSEAIESYNIFKKQVGKKTAREMDVAQFLQQCNENKGEIVASEISKPEVVNNDKVVVSQPEIKQTEQVVVQPVAEKETPPKATLPSSYDNILDEAIEFQIKADSLNMLIAKQKKDLEKIVENDKAPLRVKIRENEVLAASFQKSADQKYGEAQAVLISQNNEKKKTVQQPENNVSKDSARLEQKKIVAAPEKVSDTIRKVMPVVSKLTEIFSLFDVSANPSSEAAKKIIIDGEIPEGLVYRIQIGVFSKPVAPAYFKGISPIYAFKVPGTENRSYYAGMFRKSSDAGKALARVRATGFKDAFVVALAGGTRVSSDRATVMEKEWGDKPFSTVTSKAPSDTIPPTLLFRVEAMRSLKPLKEEAVEGIRKMSGNRGMDIEQIEKGETVYLIGKFITFESAAEYADLMIRNGYREAKVVAFLGKKEIPVDTAREFVDKRK